MEAFQSIHMKILQILRLSNFVQIFVNVKSYIRSVKVHYQYGAKQDLKSPYLKAHSLGLSKFLRHLYKAFERHFDFYLGYVLKGMLFKSF